MAKNKDNIGTYIALAGIGLTAISALIAYAQYKKKKNLADAAKRP